MRKVFQIAFGAMLALLLLACDKKPTESTQPTDPTKGWVLKAGQWDMIASGAVGENRETECFIKEQTVDDIFEHIQIGMASTASQECKQVSKQTENGKPVYISACKAGDPSNGLESVQARFVFDTVNNDHRVIDITLSMMLKDDLTPERKAELAAKKAEFEKNAKSRLDFHYKGKCA